ncbi:hypothetical protein BSKO_10932 [Bryopsis sp. KO-2023]|nr:hypothetical protein BSKO_10932 [Bryopsis sp. KO-2023]
MAEDEKIKCMVTGGAGFLGQNLVKQLVETGKYDVSIFDVRPPPDSAGLTGVPYVKGDLTKIESISDALNGVKVVFHVATVTPTAENTTNEELMYAVNVTGAQNVIQASASKDVEKLIFTSSASVVFEGQDLVNVGEDLPYAKNPMDYYTSTKIQAERLILAANGLEGKLATCALRPSAIFGEGDTVMVPTVVARAKKGKMKYIIGDGENQMDFTYVGNVAQAHIDAAEKLTLESPLAGKPYFITNQDPQKFWGFMGDILEGLDYERPHIKLPYLLIFIVVFIFEYIIVPLLAPFKDLKSDLTVNRIKLSKCNRVFQCDRAKKDFGYIPKVPMDEALKRLLGSFEHLRNPEPKKEK